MKFSTNLILSLFLLALLAQKITTNKAEAINEAMDNASDPKHQDSKLHLTEEQILEIETEDNDGEFGIKNIHKRITALKRRWNRIKDSQDLTSEEKQIVKDHLENLEKLREKNYDAHEKISALIEELDGIEKELSAKAEGDL